VYNLLKYWPLSSKAETFSPCDSLKSVSSLAFSKSLKVKRKAAVVLCPGRGTLYRRRAAAQGQHNPPSKLSVNKQQEQNKQKP
jgi:hypothetical protein